MLYKLVTAILLRRSRVPERTVYLKGLKYILRVDQPGAMKRLVNIAREVAASNQGSQARDQSLNHPGSDLGDSA
jgi:hypothetical protein